MENWEITKNKVSVDFFEENPEKPGDFLFQHRTFPDKTKAVSWIDTALYKRKVKQVVIKTITELNNVSSDGNI